MINFARRLNFNYMMYKLKHIPTGLYYQPVKDGNNLSKRGKIYQTKQNPLTMSYYSDGNKRKKLYISVSKRSTLFKQVESILTWRDARYGNDILAETFVEDWIEEYISNE